MTLDDLQARRTRMIDYLKLKVDESDWHGVADAAMDLREIEAMQRLSDKMIAGFAAETEADKQTRELMGRRLAALK